MQWTIVIPDAELRQVAVRWLAPSPRRDALEREARNGSWTVLTGPECRAAEMIYVLFHVSWLTFTCWRIGDRLGWVWGKQTRLYGPHYVTLKPRLGKRTWRSKPVLEEKTL